MWQIFVWTMTPICVQKDAKMCSTLCTDIKTDRDTLCINFDFEVNTKESYIYMMKFVIVFQELLKGLESVCMDIYVWLRVYIRVCFICILWWMCDYNDM